MGIRSILLVRGLINNDLNELNGHNDLNELNDPDEWKQQFKIIRSKISNHL
jgi:hypothetical protein